MEKIDTREQSGEQHALFVSACIVEASRFVDTLLSKILGAIQTHGNKKALKRTGHSAFWFYQFRYWLFLDLSEYGQLVSFCMIA